MMIRQLFISLLVALCLSGTALASEREYAIKSGFMFNFARYSHGLWFSDDPEEHYVLCGFSPEFTAAAKQALAGQSLFGAEVMVRQLNGFEEELSGCHTLFVSRDDVAEWTHIAGSQQLKNMMLVGESDDFIESGGHIRFYVVGGKVRFEIDPEGLEKAGIAMSSKVLRLGRIYKRDQS
ncbi:DUF4154 domain-containing protein [Vibrio sp. HA2012]|uniref:YfiR family protein n=1 Tax=Vibrio sp. HA2012 TaxID=1971595 RepID=UPI000C2CC12E|nr:YfiR family protein [Vibrio sp. HA2012]PJC87453.1 DUF4154 domain-containing protein [Vibrio sp. HA2012]